MTYFNQWFFPVITLLSGTALTLLLAFWLSGLLFTSAAIILLAYQAIHHSAQFWLIVRFITEFMGFCFLVTLFVALTVGLNQFFA